MSIEEAKSVQAFARQHDPRFTIEIVPSAYNVAIRCQRVGIQSYVWYGQTLSYVLDGVQELGAEFQTAALTWRVGMCDYGEATSILLGLKH